jgi:hypothetical protein
MLQFLKLLSFLLVLTVTNATAGYVVAFRGINDQFDTRAFMEYADLKKLQPKIFSPGDITGAINFINQPSTGRYELYGFSQGAVSVSRVLEHQHRHNKQMPSYVITIGAYKTTNVDFTRYQVNFDNYFDRSGLGSAGPGRYLPNVAHMKMQRRVNDFVIEE